MAAREWRRIVESKNETEQKIQRGQDDPNNKREETTHDRSPERPSSPNQSSQNGGLDAAQATDKNTEEQVPANRRLQSTDHVRAPPPGIPRSTVKRQRLLTQRPQRKHAVSALSKAWINI